MLLKDLQVFRQIGQDLYMIAEFGDLRRGSSDGQFLDRCLYCWVMRVMASLLGYWHPTKSHYYVPQERSYNNCLLRGNAWCIDHVALARAKPEAVYPLISNARSCFSYCKSWNFSFPVFVVVACCIMHKCEAKCLYQDPDDFPYYVDLSGNIGSSPDVAWLSFDSGKGAKKGYHRVNLHTMHFRGQRQSIKSEKYAC